MASRNPSFVYLGVPLSRHQLGATQHTVVSLFLQNFSLALKSHDQLQASDWSLPPRPPTPKFFFYSFFLLILSFFFFFWQRGGSTRLRVYYQRGLPHLVLNLEGHLNRWIGSKVTAILLNRCILPTGGVPSGRVCSAACAAGLFVLISLFFMYPHVEG